jgi:serine/threonine protein kinase
MNPKPKRPEPAPPDPWNVPTKTANKPPSGLDTPVSGGAAAPPRAGIFDALPATFGRYRVTKQLGAGGMGSVYLAHDTQLDRQVALKIPLTAGAEGPNVKERFLREARAAANLHHAYICPLHDVGEINGIPYLTMAFIDGRPFSEVLRTQSTPFKPRTVAVLIRKLALALEDAHKHQVIHRDLKPANIMITARGDPIIMDFGLARRGGTEDARLTQAGAIMGTPAYMAPEQARGNLDEIGPACDIYSLGVILYEMLAGQRPFTGDGLTILAQLMKATPPAPSTHRPDVDPELEAICKRAMAKQVADRYPSMNAMAAALTEFLKRTGDPADAPAPVAPTTPFERADRKPSPALAETQAGSRGGILAIIGGVGLLCIVGALAVAPFLFLRPTNDGKAALGSTDAQSPPTSAPIQPGHEPNKTSRPEAKATSSTQQPLNANVPVITYSWPDKNLRSSLIQAPNLTAVKPWLLRDKFTDAKSGLPEFKSPEVERGYHNGKFVFRFHKSPATDMVEIPVGLLSAQASGDFAVEMVATTTHQLTRFGVVLADRAYPDGAPTSVFVLGSGMIFAGYDSTGAKVAKLQSKAVKHPAIVEGSKGKGILTRNALLVVVKGRYLEAFVNGKAVLQPVLLDRPLKSPRFSLSAATSSTSGSAEVEVESLTIWPATSIPELDARGAISSKTKAEAR